MLKIYLVQYLSKSPNFMFILPLFLCCLKFRNNYYSSFYCTVASTKGHPSGYRVGIGHLIPLCWTQKNCVCAGCKAKGHFVIKFSHVRVCHIQGLINRGR